MCIVSISSNAGWNVFSPVLVDLPRFKGLDWGCVFHGAIDRLTLHYCDERFPHRLTRKCTHLPDLLLDIKAPLLGKCMYSTVKYLMENIIIHKYK